MDRMSNPTPLETAFKQAHGGAKHEDWATKQNEGKCGKRYHIAGNFSGDAIFANSSMAPKLSFVVFDPNTSYVTVSEKRGHSAQSMNFQLAVPADSAKPAL